MALSGGILGAACTRSPATTLDRVVDAGGVSLYIHCVGQGEPRVVFDAGLGNDGSVWSGVLPAVGRFTKACTYDRAGLGQSGPAPRPHTNRRMADELRALLSNAGLGGPYVLVGHSMGGVNVRLFASEHLDEVAGVVLVDAVGDEQFTRWFVLFPEAMKAEFRKGLTALPEGLDFDTYVSGVAEMSSSSRTLGDRPLVVLSHGKAQHDPGVSAEVQSEMEGVWADMQGQLCRLSSNCARAIAAKSGHYIQRDEPQLVVASVRAVVDSVRAHAPLDTTRLSQLGTMSPAREP